MSEVELLAKRCEREAENWRGEPMHDALLELAEKLRILAKAPSDTPTVEIS